MTDLSPEGVTARLRRVAELSDLAPEQRLAAKVPMTPEAVTARLREASDLLALCRALRAEADAEISAG
jgi:hypothetical protein